MLSAGGESLEQTFAIFISSDQTKCNGIVCLKWEINSGIYIFLSCLYGLVSSCTKTDHLQIKTKRFVNNRFKGFRFCDATKRLSVLNMLMMRSSVIYIMEKCMRRVKELGLCPGDSIHKIDTKITSASAWNMS